MPKKTEDRPKTLEGKLSELYGRVHYIVHDADNRHDGYSYTTETTIMATLRSHAHDLGLIIHPPSAESFEIYERNNGADGKGKPAAYMFVKYEFRVGNADGPDEKVYKGIGGSNLLAARDKAPYVAQTGAYKYFMQKLGLLPSYDSDPEDDRFSEAGTTQAGNKSEELRPDYSAMSDKIFNYLCTAKSPDKLRVGLEACKDQLERLKQDAPDEAKLLGKKVKELQKELSEQESKTSKLADDLKGKDKADV